METEQLTELMTQLYKVMATDDFADAVATMMWNIYTKMKAKGFSEEQAMQITLHFAKSTSNKS